MTNISVFTSTTADGTMFNREDKKDPSVIANRERFLNMNGLSATQTTFLYTNLNDRIAANESDYCRYIAVSLTEPKDIVADAVITQDSDHALFLPIADCVATTIFDPTTHVLMLSHLGRHSLEQQGATKSVQFLVNTYGSRPEDLLVWSSPAPNKDVYPIWKLNNKGMKEAWFEQLDHAGVLLKHISDNPADSATDPQYYSYSEYLKGHREEDGDYCMVAVMND